MLWRFWHGLHFRLHLVEFGGEVGEGEISGHGGSRADHLWDIWELRDAQARRELPIGPLHGRADGRRHVGGIG